MPVWATVAISLGTALISAAAALGGSLLRGKQERFLYLVRGRQERALQLHDRRIKAAGDLSIGANKTSTDLKDAVRSAPNPGDPANKEVLDHLHESLHEAEAHAVVASLLFEAPDAPKSADVTELLRGAVLEVRALCGESVPEVPAPSVEGVQAKAEAADEALKASNEAVLKALEE
jgi:hypothetical protein